ncbi:MAG: DNA polymerase III subunit beta [Bacteroidota bacterium]
MNFIVSSSYLLKQLQVLGSVINSNNTLPILDNFLFELDNNQLHVSSSDLETTMSASLEIESNSKGSVAIPAKLLLDILKTFPEQPLTFTIEENNTVEISSNSGKYAIAYAAGEEFPKAVALEDPSTTLVPAEVLATAIGKTIFATGNDDLRPVMSGVFFQFSTEGLIFVATDAHKLVKYARADVKASQSAEFIMPKKPLTILKGILATSDAEVKVEYNDSNATYSFENYILTCRLIDGKYPNYEAVIPKVNPNKLTIDRSALTGALKRVSIYSNKATHQVRFKIAGSSLMISAEDIDFSNAANERLTCTYVGEDMEIGFNSKFLLDMLNNLESDEIDIEMSAPNRAGIITPNKRENPSEDVLMLVMPVMLNN